ncbi:hypothetical protein EXV95_00905 [Acidovorax sp. JMULE5]|uniref:hypothetical protein n=1 Tax=Acidovorax sp. JMULE5 TaxID=2518343 RepID=UPI00159F8BAE|nr:hypothetical protein [Acidovorax sp. JMULE5]QLA79356.1 hypothetical protein EXV95_00905 [Acidovorax sp. JMULE5]
MKPQSPRQLGLYFAACLYQLASEFNSDELAIILEEHRLHGHSKAIIAAIRAIQDLHASDQKLKVSPSESKNETKDFTPQQSRLSASLADIFADQKRFPTVSSISEVTKFDRKPKEARDRYIFRMQKHFSSLPEDERQIFLKGISQRVNKVPGNFVSKWSDLIQGT